MPAVPATAGSSVRELFANSLRMRPDRIIVGEVRGGEALDLIQSMISGHAGSMSTIHATTPLDAPDSAGNAVADVRRGDSGLRGPGAGGLGDRFDRADRPVYARMARARSPASRRPSGWTIKSSIRLATCSSRGSAERTRRWPAGGRSGCRPASGRRFCREPWEQGMDGMIHHTEGTLGEK